MDGKKTQMPRERSQSASEPNIRALGASSTIGRACRLARRVLQPRRPAWRDLLGFVALVVGAVASMATNMADPPSSEKKEVAPAEVVSCEVDEDCASNAENTFCMESYDLCVQCQEDDHCGAQERCMDFRCAASCETHSECAGDLICMDSLCQQCEADADCGDPAQYCYIGAEFNACRPLCEASAECAGPGYTVGDVCRGGRCQAIECAVPQDCLINRELCDNQTHLCAPIQ